MRISDWSSDVCSSDLPRAVPEGTTWISNQTLADMTLHSFLTFARDLSARAWRWTRRNGHALAAYIAARTHAGAAYLHARSAARPATAIAVLVIGGLVV